MATSLDLFVLWTILLMAVGLKGAAGRKLSFTGALVAVGAPWFAMVLIGASFAKMFG